MLNSEKVNKIDLFIANWSLSEFPLKFPEFGRVGLRTKDQVVDIAGVFDWDLSPNEFKYIDDLSQKIIKKLPSNPFISN